MKIAYIGNFEPEYSTENDVRKAFEYLGHKVLRYQENKPLDLSNVQYDLLLITGTWDGYNLNSWYNIIKDHADKKIPTATLHLDTFWGKSRGGRKWWLHPMFHTAYIFTADGDYEDEWKLFGKNHIWLPPAIRHDAAKITRGKPEYICDVALVGSNGIGYHQDVWSYRKQLADKLREICKRRKWQFKNPGGDDPKINRNDDMNDFYASAQVTVGDSLCLKKEKSKYWSDRVPEAWGRGGYLIMPQIDAIPEVLGIEQPMYRWGDWHDLENKIEQGINLQNKNLELRTRNQRSIAENDTYVNRVQTILETIFNNG